MLPIFDKKSSFESQSFSEKKSDIPHTGNATVGEDYTLGYTEGSGVGNYGLSNYQMGSWYETTTGGIVDSISVYMEITYAGGGKVKCSLYDYVDYSSDFAGGFIDSTEEKIWTSTLSGRWVTFNFSEPKPTIDPLTKYYVFAWGNRSGSANDIKFKKQDGTGVNFVYDGQAYGAWENPATDESDYNFVNMSIYLSYHNYSHITDNWDYYKKITINSSLVDANLTNFPILVSNTSSDFSNHARADGYDFVFMNETNETKYNHEIERYNSTTGELIAWINITTLREDVDTIMWLFYGNATTGTQENVVDTWNSNYVAVWHMDDNTTSQVQDSTSNEYDGTKEGANQPLQTTSQIGYGQNFSNAYVIDINSPIIPNNFTIEAWIMGDGITGTYDAIIGQYTGGQAGRFHFSQYNGGIAGEMNYRIGDNSTASASSYNVGWHYTVLSRSSYGANELICYINKSIVFTDTADENLYTGMDTHLGGLSNPEELYSWNNLLDEIRVSTGARNRSWLNTTYDNQNSPSTFLTVGSEQTVSAADVTWQNIFTGYASGGNITSPQNIFTGYATGGNATVSWQQIFTGYATGGNATVSWQQIFTGYATGGNITSPQNIFTGYATGGNATVSWQQIFYGYATGGNITGRSWQNIFTGYATGGNITSPQNIFTGYATGGNDTVIWQQIFTGYATGGNITSPQNIFTGYATGGNISRVWQNIFTGYASGGNDTDPINIFTGYATGGNVTIAAFDIYNPYPPNATSIYKTQPLLFFNLTHPKGYTMNYSIYYGNTSVTCTNLLHTETNVSNGSQKQPEQVYYDAINYNQEYYWRVQGDDGHDHINATWFFAVMIQSGGNGSLVLAILGIMAIVAISIVIFLARKRREDQL